MSWDHLLLGAIAFLNAFTAIMTYHNKKAVEQTRKEVAKLEVNTNSKMDKLLTASVGEAFGKGVAQERADTEAKKGT